MVVRQEPAVPFVPPRCPNTGCPHHRNPTSRFFKRTGFYRAMCRTEPIPRYLCCTCRRSFSAQTFKVDYRDHRPHVNARVFALLTSGVGFRQTSRNVGLSHVSVLRKAMKLGRSLGELHKNLMQGLQTGLTYVLDEEETYETSPLRPLTVPYLLEHQTWFVVATDVEPIRRLARRGSSRRDRQDRYERKNGPRPDRSRTAVRRVLEALRAATGPGPMSLVSDMKSSYPVVAKAVFGEDLKRHRLVSSRLPRDSCNPLFAVNLTIEMGRDNIGRLRPHSWLASKKGDRLRSHLHLYVAFRNYVRKRFNRDRPHETPAVLLGLLPRQLGYEEALRWRQDWGMISGHPLSPAGQETISDRGKFAPAPTANSAGP